MTPAEQELLLTTLAGFSANPLGFVLWAYPWGEPDGELADHAAGPEPWQRDLLNSLGQGVITVNEAIAAANNCDPLLFARASGHGIGKSALVSWIIDWALSTFVDTKGVVTANTENQLKTKTWAEMAKWHRISLTKELFRMTATARFSIDPDHEKTWRIDMVPWSAKNMEAFAGLHNKGKRILIVFDEASAIDDPIWETTEGALTDKNTQIIWVCFGNPTKNSGRFRECFDSGRFAHRWNSSRVDSREVSITNKAQIQKWIDDYGADHDFVRVRVLGTFPRQDAVSFIPLELVRESMARPLPEENREPVVLGVDVARFGDDSSVIYPRQGRDARTRRVERYSGISTLVLAKYVLQAYSKYNVTTIYVDGGGVGGGVVDQLLHMGLPVIEVQFGARPDQTNPQDGATMFANKRAEMWGAMRDALPTLCLPNDLPLDAVTLEDELTSPSYTFVRNDQYLQLETKREMRRRGSASPDIADALALTFASPAYVHAPLAGALTSKPYSTDYNPYEVTR